MKRNLTFTLLFLFLTLFLASCAPAGSTGTTYGTLSGILHGIIFPFALISKLYTAEYALYAIIPVHCTGLVMLSVWQDFLGGGVYSRR